jgi:hypothetical protein
LDCPGKKFGFLDSEKNEKWKNGKIGKNGHRDQKNGTPGYLKIETVEKTDRKIHEK